MKLKFAYKGGPGSGHYGHAGRPGKVGGGLPEGMMAAAQEAMAESNTMVGNVKPGGKTLSLLELNASIDAHNKRVERDGVSVYDRWGTHIVRNDGRTVSFNTPEEADMWLNEIHGQLSDGKWESQWNSKTYKPYLYKVKIDPTQPTKFPKQQWGDPHLSFSDLGWLFGENDTYEARGRYTQPEATKLLKSISKAYRASYSQ